MNDIANKPNNTKINNHTTTYYKLWQQNTDVYKAEICPCKRDNKRIIMIFIDILTYYMRVETDIPRNATNDDLSKIEYLYPRTIRILMRYYNKYITQIRERVRILQEELLQLVIEIRDALMFDPNLNEQDFDFAINVYKTKCEHMPKMNIKRDIRMRQFCRRLFSTLIRFNNEYRQNIDKYFKDHIYHLFKTDPIGGLRNIKSEHMYIRAHAGLVTNSNDNSVRFENKLDSIVTYNVFGCITIAPMYTSPNDSYKKIFRKGDMVPDVSFSIKNVPNKNLIYLENSLLKYFFIAKGETVMKYDDPLFTNIFQIEEANLYQGGTFEEQKRSFKLSDLHNNILTSNEHRITGIELIGNCLSKPALKFAIAYSGSL